MRVRVERVRAQQPDRLGPQKLRRCGLEGAGRRQLIVGQRGRGRTVQQPYVAWTLRQTADYLHHAKVRHLYGTVAWLLHDQNILEVPDAEVLGPRREVVGLKNDRDQIEVLIGWKARRSIRRHGVADLGEKEVESLGLPIGHETLTTKRGAAIAAAEVVVMASATDGCEANLG